MPTTSNFGWTTPADTDLVKDGAAAIRTLGNGIDTSLVDLKGGTTGQILSKASNTDLDYTWITNDVGDITSVVAGVGMSGGGTTGAVTLTNDMASTITASGDIVVGTGSGTYDNLPIGTTGEVLTADTTVSPYKVKWAAASSGGMTSLASGNLSTGSSTTVLNTISGSYKDLRLVLRNFYQSGNGNIHIQPNSATTFVYFQTATNNTNTVTDTVNTAASTFNINYNAPTVSSSNNVAVIDFYDYTDTTINKPMIAIAEYTLASRDELTINQGVAKISGAITSITITATTNNFGGGTYELFGIK